MASSTTGNIVTEWLRSLHLGQYAESFIDNGYDDLEICKQVGEPDLDAIGVLNPTHRQRLLHSVRSLREEGAATVYFTLEEAAAARDTCRCEEESRKEQASAIVEPAKYADEYEEGKAELVKIPRIQLKRLLRERLGQDGIRLSLQPYSTTVSVFLALSSGQCFSQNIHVQGGSESQVDESILKKFCVECVKVLVPIEYVRGVCVEALPAPRVISFE